VWYRSKDNPRAQLGNAWRAAIASLESERIFNINSERWPDVARVPRSFFRRYAATAAFLHLVRGLPLRVRINSIIVGDGNDDAPTIIIVRPRDFFRRLGVGGLIGFGESYLAGDWEANDLVGVLSVFAARIDSLVPLWLQRLRRYYVPRPPREERNTSEGSAKNVRRHYDLPIGLFQAFLDETMSYSSALFTEDDLLTYMNESHVGWHHPTGVLAEAQCRKMDRLLDMTHVGAGTRLLELGTGWGGLALRAAKRGARVESLTISREQYEFASRQIQEKNLVNSVNIRLQDYREAVGLYDAIISIEMIEAVGEEYWPVYFWTIDRLLAPGGFAGIQAITMPHERMVATRRNYTWIHKYIFPGGLIPSMEAMSAHIASNTRLKIIDDYAFGASYARTIQLWQERFEDGRRNLNTLGLDETFDRMWTFYLAYVESGFRVGYLDVHQLVLA
jgi:cyclopropane-fatty-acyl-phospholipid synthase